MRPNSSQGSGRTRGCRSLYADTASSRVRADRSASSSDDVDEARPGEHGGVDSDVAEDDEFASPIRSSCAREVSGRLEGDHAGRQLGLAFDRGRLGGGAAARAPPTARCCPDASRTARPEDAEFQPTWSMWTCVRKTVSGQSHPSALELPQAAIPGARAATHRPGGPTPVSTRIVRPPPRIRYERNGSRHRSPVEELRVPVAPRRPVVLAGIGERLRVRRERALRIEERVDLVGADYHRTRGGAGSPWPSCHEITGLRSTPIFSISASITSPGLR